MTSIKYEINNFRYAKYNFQYHTTIKYRNLFLYSNEVTMGIYDPDPSYLWCILKVWTIIEGQCKLE